MKFDPGKVFPVPSLETLPAQMVKTLKRPDIKAFVLACAQHAACTSFGQIVFVFGTREASLQNCLSKKLMDWFRKLLREAPSALLGVIVGWWLSGQTAKQIADLEHRPAFIAESLAFVVEFTEFYDQQSRDFKAVRDNFDQLLPAQRKAFMEESLKKLSTAEKQTNLLEFKATRYFHGTDWLEKFEEIHKIWSSAAQTANIVYKQQLSSESVYWDWRGSLSKDGDHLSETTAKLLNQFILILKSLPPESGFLGDPNTNTRSQRPKMGLAASR